MTAPIAQHGARLAPLMRKAGFRYVFLGIENILDEDLGFLRARAKNARRDNGRTIGNASIEAIEHLHRHGMYVVGGLIVGNPDDTRESIEANLEFARRYVDWPYIQHPTPYPGTPMTRDFRERGLIVDEDVAHYDGTTAVVRSAHVAAEDIEFLRWRAERWMKMRHLPATFLHSPRFVLANGLRMLAHTFAGTTLRSAVGLEDESAVFARFRARRRAERDYVRLEPHELLAPQAGRAEDGGLERGRRRRQFLRQDASFSATPWRAAVSTRPLDLAPSARLIAGAERSPSTVAVSRTTMRAPACTRPLTRPPMTTVSAATVALTRPSGVIVSAWPLTLTCRPDARQSSEAPERSPHP